MQTHYSEFDAGLTALISMARKRPAFPGLPWWQSRVVQLDPGRAVGKTSYIHGRAIDRDWLLLPRRFAGGATRRFAEERGVAPQILSFDNANAPFPACEKLAFCLRQSGAPRVVWIDEPRLFGGLNCVLRALDTSGVFDREPTDWPLVVALGEP